MPTAAKAAMPTDLRHVIAELRSIRSRLLCITESSECKESEVACSTDASLAYGFGGLIALNPPPRGVPTLRLTRSVGDDKSARHARARAFPALSDKAVRKHSVRDSYQGA